ADVWSALQNAERSELSVLIDPASSHSPPLDDRAFDTAYEIRVGAKMICAYAAVSKSWRSDNDIGTWLGYGTAITGVALLFAAFLAMDTTASSLASECGQHLAGDHLEGRTRLARLARVGRDDQRLDPEARVGLGVLDDLGGLGAERVPSRTRGGQRH